MPMNCGGKTMRSLNPFRYKCASIAALTISLFLLTVVSLPGARKTSLPAKAEGRALSAPTSAQRLRIMESYGKLPLRFEPNQGQSDPRVRYLSRGPGYALYLTDTHAEIALRRDGKQSQVKVTLDGAQSPHSIH